MIQKRILNHDRVRKAGNSFGFIPHRFLSEGYFRVAGQHELLLYMFLVVASDRYGLSYYGGTKICSLLDFTTEEYKGARDQLIARDLIAFDGTIFQLLELPSYQGAPR